MAKIKLLLSIFLFSFITVHSQPSVIKHFTMQEGLPSNMVFYVFFDSKGYMWAATDKGLVRYNGRNFTIFTTFDGLPDNEIFGLNEDDEGRLWISNYKGVLCYYKDNVFHTEANTPWLKLTSNKTASYFGRFRKQKDSSLISEAVDGSSIIDIKHETLKIINTDELKRISTTKRDVLAQKINDSVYQVFYNHESYLIDHKSNLLKTILYKDTTEFSSCNSAHDEYLATRHGIYTVDEKPIYLREIKKFNKYAARFIYIQDKYNIFLCSSYGLLYNKNKILLKNNYLTSIDHDNLGNIWVSSLGNGIFCISKNLNNITNIPVSDKIISTKYNSNTIHFVTEKGNIYELRNNKQVAAPILSNIKGNEIAFSQKNTCITDSGDVLRISDSAFFYKERNQKSFKCIRLEINPKFYQPAKCIYYFNDTFYISFMSSIGLLPLKYLKNQNTIDPKDIISNIIGIYDRIFYSAINRTDSSFWFAKAKQMFRIKNGNTQKIEKFKNYTFRQFNFYKNYLVGSTDDNKLFIYNAGSGIWDSLPNSNSIWENIYQINDRTAIISTNNYYKILYMYPPDKHGNPQYKLQVIENPFIPEQADYIFGDGQMYFFEKNNLLSGFSINILSEIPPPPTPLFTSIKTAHLVYPARPKIHISYNEAQTINIKIDNISYSDKNPTTQYSISENGKDNWNTISSDEINLNGTSYGSYTIKLRSKTISSNFSKPEILILEVAKPFWAEWWFIALCSIVFLFVVYAVIQILILRKLRKNQREHDSEMKFQQSEYKALNALMNPHFIFNSLNNIQSLINKNNNNTANQYLVIFSKLIRQNMMNVSKGFVSLYQELQLVENYLNLEKLRFKDLINFSIEVDEEIDTEEIMISPLLIQPLVENAIIHGLLPQQSKNSTVEIKIREQNDILHIEINDNGIGITQSLKNKSKDRESYGLSNLNLRIEHLRKIQKREINFEIKEIIDEHGESKGTSANIKISIIAN